jgi:uncharacterized protein YbjQ (UPF0145 family)
MKQRIIVTTGNAIDGAHITEYVGVVRGIVVRATGIARGFLGSFKSLVGGNVRSYELVCEEARSQAFTRMVEHARQLGADGIIAMRYDATEFMAGVTEVLAYGTAVKLHSEALTAQPVT